MYYMLLMLLSLTGFTLSEQPQKANKSKKGHYVHAPANSIADLLSQNSLVYTAQDETINDEQVTVEIDIHDTRVTSLDGLDTIPGIKTCKRLSINHTAVSDIAPRNFENLTQLEELSITDNPHLHTIMAHSFAALKKLIFLDLSDNVELKKLEDGIFNGLSALQELNISNRHIRMLKMYWCLGLDSIRVIYTKGLGDQMDQRIYKDVNTHKMIAKRGWRVEIVRD